jgi:hypothetical protein
MTTAVTAKLIANRARNGFSIESSEELMVTLLITCKDQSSLIERLVDHQFATEEEALLMVAA